MIKIPFSFLPINFVKGVSNSFLSIGDSLERFFPKLDEELKQIDSPFKAKEYLTMCLISNFFFSLFLIVTLIFPLKTMNVQNAVLSSIIVTIIIDSLIFLQQINYPKIKINKKAREIEQNLLPALQDISIQINSGIPLFSVLVNISNSNYGAVSIEFKKIVKKINSGISQIEALEEVTKNSPSPFFRRSIWQLINGMREGSDIAKVIGNITKTLSEEQLIQIQNYGSQLSPLAMFYMLIAVIIPSLSVTFITVISSFISAPELVTKILFWSLYGLVLFFQIIILGLIKSKRPAFLLV